MKTILTIGLVSALALSLQASEAEKLFDSKCGACHIKTRHTDRSKMVAPPIMGVLRHVKMTYPTKEKAVSFIKDYVFNPSKDKAVCMPQKIARFGLMPSQKGAVSEAEVEKIASWLYDNFPPKGFRGMGRGMMGKGMNRP
jgi:mono/diheme cytochrome c family protein